MTIHVDLFWLAGLISVLLAYRPLLNGVIETVKTGVRAYRFAKTYVDLPGEVHGIELRVDDLEHVVFPPG